MRKPHAPAVRKLLKQHPSGLRASDICAILNIRCHSLHAVMEKMPDCYIDRWVEPVMWRLRMRYTAVWCIADIPEDCPYPESSKSVMATRAYNRVKQLQQKAVNGN